MSELPLAEGTGPDAPRHGRLAQIADEISTASGLAAADPGFHALGHFLAEVRQVLAMDVVFASQFVGDRRVFRCVSADGNFDVPIAPGQSDALLDTYCRLIVESRIPAVVADSAEHAELAQLPVTRSLRISAYLGVPIVLADGSVFGTLCCISHSPRRDLLDSDAAALRLIAHAIAGSVVDGQARGGIWSNI